MSPVNASPMSLGLGFSRSGRNSRQATSFTTIGVFTVVGFTVLTRIMYGASSWARLRIKPITPCLAAE